MRYQHRIRNAWLLLHIWLNRRTLSCIDESTELYTLVVVVWVTYHLSDDSWIPRQIISFLLKPTNAVCGDHIHHMKDCSRECVSQVLKSVCQGELDIKECNTGARFGVKLKHNNYRNIVEALSRCWCDFDNKHFILLAGSHHTVMRK